MRFENGLQALECPAAVRNRQFQANGRVLLKLAHQLLMGGVLLQSRSLNVTGKSGSSARLQLGEHLHAFGRENRLLLAGRPGGGLASGGFCRATSSVLAGGSDRSCSFQRDQLPALSDVVCHLVRRFHFVRRRGRLFPLAAIAVGAAGRSRNAAK